MSTSQLKPVMCGITAGQARVNPFEQGQVCVQCRPRLKYWMDYVQEHPEEINKIASVQKKVR